MNNQISLSPLPPGWASMTSMEKARWTMQHGTMDPHPSVGIAPGGSQAPVQRNLAVAPALDQQTQTAVPPVTPQNIQTDIKKTQGLPPGYHTCSPGEKREWIRNQLPR